TMARESNSKQPDGRVASETRQRNLRRELLFEFGEKKERWTVGDALEGTQIFGATGSGKTTGSGATLARRMLEKNFGGLVLTAKPDELLTWLRYFNEADRDLADITVI